MSAEVDLTPVAVEAIAQRVAELLREDTLGAIGTPAAPELIGTAEVAHLLGVSRDYVYSNADALGAIRLGDGPKARLRFDAAKVAECMAAGYGNRRAQAPAKPDAKPKPRRRSTRRLGSGVALLPVRPGS